MKIHIHTNSNKDEIKLIVSQILDLSCMNFQTQDLIKVKKKVKNKKKQMILSTF